MSAVRIVVLQTGRIVQTYRELLSKPGPFADRTHRQLLGEKTPASA